MLHIALDLTDSLKHSARRMKYRNCLNLGFQWSVLVKLNGDSPRIPRIEVDVAEYRRLDGTKGSRETECIYICVK
jgi:hypothetical protein